MSFVFIKYIVTMRISICQNGGIEMTNVFASMSIVFWFLFILSDVVLGSSIGSRSSIL